MQEIQAATLSVALSVPERVEVRAAWPAQLSLVGIHAGEGFEGTIHDKELLMEVRSRPGRHAGQRALRVSAEDPIWAVGCLHADLCADHGGARAGRVDRGRA